MAGPPASDFALQDQDGRTVRLADFRGKQEVILLFYMGAL
jgi:peroxiredoxin